MKKGNSDVRPNLSPRTPRYQGILTFALWIILLVLISASVYVVMIPKEGEKFTEFYLLGPEGRAGNYPHTIVPDRSYSLLIGIRNHEYREITYTVEEYLAEERYDPVNNTSSLMNLSLVEKYNVIIPHDEKFELVSNFTVSTPGPNRILFLLFDTTPPTANITGFDRLNASYRDLRLIIDTTPRSPS